MRDILGHTTSFPRFSRALTLTSLQGLYPQSWRRLPPDPGSNQDPNSRDPRVEEVHRRPRWGRHARWKKSRLLRCVPHHGHLLFGSSECVTLLGRDSRASTGTTQNADQKVVPNQALDHGCFQSKLQSPHRAWSSFLVWDIGWRDKEIVHLVDVQIAA